MNDAAFNEVMRDSVMRDAEGNSRGGNPLQNTAEWLQQRCGFLTSSRIADAMAVSKRDGKPLKCSEDLVKTILAERMTGDTMPSGYVSDEMRHGINKQADAQSAYEARTGNFVDLTGFIEHPSIQWLGCSPDGLVDDDGLVEFKCPKTTTHLEYLMRGVVVDDYKPQMLLQLACTRRVWCDFVSFDDRIRNPAHRLFIVRFEPKASEIEEVEEFSRKYLAIVHNLFEQLHGRA